MSKLRTKLPFYKNRFYFGLLLIFVLVCFMGLLVKAGNDKYRSELSKDNSIENVSLKKALNTSVGYTSRK